MGNLAWEENMSPLFLFQLAEQWNQTWISVQTRIGFSNCLQQLVAFEFLQLWAHTTSAVQIVHRWRFEARLTILFERLGDDETCVASFLSNHFARNRTCCICNRLKLATLHAAKDRWMSFPSSLFACCQVHDRLSPGGATERSAGAGQEADRGKQPG